MDALLGQIVKDKVRHGTLGPTGNKDSWQLRCASPSHGALGWSDEGVYG
ncbi:hypothetical protein GCM10007158_02220 [Vreelandella hamiltonii]|uniref:Uncharacterized protein n=1 Tax=Halomonas johnsoniae TaxID=502832 RepID=A0ABQ2WA62_9GAMM|nr:hypothetical protein GCM10007158_02220 [Halomonas johnsoniae]